MRNNYSDLDAQPGIAFSIEEDPGDAAVITVDADPDQFWVLDWIAWSYSDDPAAGNISVSFGGTVIFSLDITHGGPGLLSFGDQLGLYNAIAQAKAPKNEAMVVTLSAEAGISAKLSIRYR